MGVAGQVASAGHVKSVTLPGWMQQHDIIGRSRLQARPYHHVYLALRVNGAMVRPRAESSMSVSSRLCLVSFFLALTTHQTAALRYEGAWP